MNSGNEKTSLNILKVILHNRLKQKYKENKKNQMKNI